MGGSSGQIRCELVLRLMPVKELAFSDPPRRVAIVRMSAIGDSVHTLPVVASLREAWRDTHISWVIQKVPHMLMDGRPDVDEFLFFRRELGARAYLDFRRRLQDRRFDLVLDLQPVFKGAVVTQLLSAPVKLGYDRGRSQDLSWLATNYRLPACPTAHTQDELLEFVEALGVVVRCEWNFFFTEAERDEQRRWRETIDGEVMAVVLRSSHAEKNWILERYARVLDVAEHDLGLEPVIVGGPSTDERDDANRLIDLCQGSPRVELGTDLRRLAWLLDASDVVLSPDTGPLHMAVGLGTPTVGLYGYTDPKRSGPYRRFTELTVDRYDSLGETRPSRKMRRGNMKRIREEDVLEKLELALKNYPKGQA